MQIRRAAKSYFRLRQRMLRPRSGRAAESFHTATNKLYKFIKLQPLFVKLLTFHQPPSLGQFPFIETSTTYKFMASVVR